MKTLQLGPDATNFLRFERTDSPGFTDFTITAHFDSITLSDDDLSFDQVSAFLDQFTEFERARQASAVLTALPQFTLTIAPHGSVGHAWLSYRFARRRFIGEDHNFRSHVGTVTIEAGFELPGELIAKTLEDFRDFLQ